MSEKFIDAGAQAARHLLEIGLTPLLEVDVLHALHKRAVMTGSSHGSFTSWLAVMPDD
jgi:hypothetical protein